MGEFFKEGGVGMFPTLIFGFLLVASGVLYLLRPERRYSPLLVSLGVATLCSGILSFCVGIMMTARFLHQVPEEQQVLVAMQGTQESIHNVVLAMILIVITALIVSVGSFKAARTTAAA
jgi:hypothetical protein